MKNFLNIADHSTSILRNIIDEASIRKAKRSSIEIGSAGKVEASTSIKKSDK